MRALALAALLAACAAPPPAVVTPTPTPHAGVLKVTALLDLSGRGARVGTDQREAIQRWVDARPASAPRMSVRVVDTAGSDATLFVELRRAAVEERSDALLVGVPVQYDDTLGRAVDLAGMPVLFLEPLRRDPVAEVGGRWAFALAPALEDLAAAEVADALARDLLAPSVVLVDGGLALDPMAAALAAAVARSGHDPIREVAVAVDGTVPGVVRSNGPLLASVHCLARLPACRSIAEAAASSGATTLVYLPYRITSTELAGTSELAARAVFPRLRASGPRPPWIASVHSAVAADALSLLSAAAAESPPGDHDALRATMERITMTLIATTYSFTPGRHGISEPDLTFTRWTGADVGPVIPTASP